MAKRPFGQGNGREIRENRLFEACAETEPAPVAKHTGNGSNLLEMIPYGQNLARKIEKLVIGRDFYRFGIDLATGKVLFWRLGTETKRDQPRSPNRPNTSPTARNDRLCAHSSRKNPKVDHRTQIWHFRQQFVFGKSAFWRFGAEIRRKPAPIAKLSKYTLQTVQNDSLCAQSIGSLLSKKSKSCSSDTDLTLSTAAYS